MLIQMILAFIKVETQFLIMLWLFWMWVWMLREQNPCLLSLKHSAYPQERTRWNLGAQCTLGWIDGWMDGWSHLIDDLLIVFSRTSQVPESPFPWQSQMSFKCFLPTTNHLLLHWEFAVEPWRPGASISNSNRELKPTDPCVSLRTWSTNF